LAKAAANDATVRGVRKPDHASERSESDKFVQMVIQFNVVGVDDARASPRIMARSSRAEIHGGLVRAVLSASSVLQGPRGANV